MKKTLDEISVQCKLDASLALEAVAEVFGVSKKMMNGGRVDDVIQARSAFYSLMATRRHGNADIGAIFGKDHSTVLHGKKTHVNDYTTNNRYKTNYDKAEVLFSHKINGDVSDSEEAHSLLRKLDITLEGIMEIKQMILKNYLNGDPVPETVKDVINETFPDYDKRRIIEKNIASRINIADSTSRS